jgi:hypothetical protein
MNFRDDLNDLLKRYTETDSDYYDVVDYLIQCLGAMDEALARQEAWLPKPDGTFSLRLEMPVKEVKVTDGH